MPELTNLLRGSRDGGGGRDHKGMGFLDWCRTALVEPALSVLFPPRCVGCGDFETHLCAQCRERMVAIGSDACPRCGEPGPRALVAGRCASCLGKEVPFARARSAFVHTGPARRLVVELKAGGQKVLGRLMAAAAMGAFRELLTSAPSLAETLVTWVPCHPGTQRARGYNQAEVLARELASQVPGLRATGLLEKRVSTRAQKRLDRAGRQRNLQGAFVLDERAVATLSPLPEVVVVVDDVLTTGATAAEVSSVLKEGLGVPVYIFTFSRAVGGKSEARD